MAKTALQKLDEQIESLRAPHNARAERVKALAAERWKGGPDPERARELDRELAGLRAERLERPAEVTDLLKARRALRASARAEAAQDAVDKLGDLSILSEQQIRDAVAQALEAIRNAHAQSRALQLELERREREARIQARAADMSVPDAEALYAELAKKLGK